MSSLVRHGDIHLWIHLETDPMLLDLLAFEDDECGQEFAAAANCFDDGNPLAVPRLARYRFPFAARNDNLDLLPNALHKPLLIHVVYILRGDAFFADD